MSHPYPSEGGIAVEEEPKERPTSGPTVTFDIRQILTFITFLSALMAALGYVMQLRNDVRVNTLEILELKREMQMLRDAAEDIGRAKLLYCAGKRSDTTGTLPDIGC